MKRMVCAAAIAASLLAPAVLAADAKEKPQWEFGAGVGGQYLPDYRGSDRYRGLALPFPMFRYKGDFLKVDEESVRGEFFSSDRVQLNISADTALVIGADDNELREGMPDLLPAFEVGPSVIVNLAGDESVGKWTLHLPLRIIGATDLSKAESVGLVFNPSIAYERKKWLRDWNWLARFGLLFGDSDYHSYYYAVESQYETEQRAAFDVDGGFSGAVFKFSLRKRVGQLWMGGTARYDYLANAEFVDSPLLERESSFALTFGVGWFFK
ncbi:MAG: MipA/OmpV family protein [Pseudomonadales bacterium]